MQNILTDDVLVQRCNEDIMNEYYNKLIEGLEYKYLQNKEYFFSVFEGVNRIRQFLLNSQRRMGEGEGFGENEFFQMKPRQHMMVCLKDTILLTMNSQQYNKISKSVQLLQIQKIITCFSHSIFNVLEENRNLVRIAFLYQKEKFTGKQTIYKQSDLNLDYCYFITKGQVSVIKDNKEVYILNQCGHFGDEEMLIENSSRIYTVKVKSIKATIYKITRESFLKIIDDLFPILRSTFVQFYLMHQQIRNQRQQSILNASIKQNKIQEKLKYQQEHKQQQSLYQSQPLFSINNTKQNTLAITQEQDQSKLSFNLVSLLDGLDNHNNISKYYPTGDDHQMQQMIIMNSKVQQNLQNNQINQSIMNKRHKMLKNIIFSKQKFQTVMNQAGQIDLQKIKENVKKDNSQDILSRKQLKKLYRESKKEQQKDYEKMFQCLLGNEDNKIQRNQKINQMKEVNKKCQSHQKYTERLESNINQIHQKTVNYQKQYQSQIINDDENIIQIHIMSAEKQTENIINSSFMQQFSNRKQDYITNNLKNIPTYKPKLIFPKIHHN